MVHPMASENFQCETLSDGLFKMVSVQDGGYDSEGRVPFCDCVVPIIKKAPYVTCAFALLVVCTAYSVQQL